MRAATLFRERLWPGVGFPSFMIFMGGSLAIAYQRAYHGQSGALTFFATIIVTVVTTFLVAPVVEVTHDLLRVGKARISREHLGKIAVLDAHQTKHALGQGAHGSALTVTRAAIKSSVLVEVRDENDPHPYWQFSTRRPAQLLQALQSGS